MQAHEYLEKWSKAAKNFKRQYAEDETRQLPRITRTTGQQEMEALKKSMLPTVAISSDLAREAIAQVPTKQIARPHAILDPYVRIYGLDHPLTMLYRACLACLSTHGRIPNLLFLHSSLESELAREQGRLFHTRYMQEYYFYSGGVTLEKIPVATEENMLQWLGDAIGWTFARDMAIATFDPQGKQENGKELLSLPDWLN